MLRRHWNNRKYCSSELTLSTHERISPKFWKARRKIFASPVLNQKVYRMPISLAGAHTYLGLGLITSRRHSWLMDHSLCRFRKLISTERSTSIIHVSCFISPLVSFARCTLNFESPSVLSLIPLLKTGLAGWQAGSCGKMARAIPVTSWDYVCRWRRSAKLIRGQETVTMASVALPSSQVCRRMAAWEGGGGGVLEVESVKARLERR